MLDTKPMLDFINNYGKSQKIDVENLDPSQIKPLFEKYPKVQKIWDAGHRVEY
jgi:hypothetical protein